MRLRLARKILRRKRKVRFATAWNAVVRLELRANRWKRRHRDAIANPRPSFTLHDLLVNLPRLLP
jgi:hypothetical protein